MKKPVAGVSMRRLGAAVASGGTVMAIALHVEFGQNAGALWRDEVSSFNVATMPTLGELWANLGFDSFPALFFVVLRTFADVLAPVSDGALRAFGVAIGLLVLAAVWLNARWLRCGFPLISLALIAFNPMVIRYGDSIRAYGLGIVLVLLCVGTMWRFAEKASAGRGLAALITAVLSVHCLYYNAFLLLAICAGATAVCVRRRAYRHALAIIGIGGISAVSLLVYLPTIRKVGSTNFFWKVDFTAGMFWTTLADALGSTRSAGPWMWALLFIGAGIGGAWCLVRHRAVDRDLLLYGFVTLLIGMTVYVAFLFHLSYMTRPWYFVAFIAFAATCIDAIIAALPWRPWALRSACALLFIAVSVKPTWSALQARQTNLDAVAEHLKTNARASDLILVNTWNYELTLRRYYDGPAQITGIPPISDVRTQRVDLVYEQMLAQAPIAPVLQQIEQTLRAGHTVWLVGTVAFVEPGRAPIPQPAPNEAAARSGAFFRAWSEQTAFLFQRHAAELVRTRVPIAEPVIQYENIPLSAIRGWRDGGDLAIR